MHIILIIVLFLVVVYGPQWWAKRTFKKHAHKQSHIPGTGGELARHLLDKYDMQDVPVEETEQGDHYDPDERVVRLSPNNYRDNSLTAVAVAAHEVGHAIQHQRKESKLLLRSKLVRIAQKSEKLGSALMIAMPVMAVVSRSPVVGLLFMLGGFVSIAGATLVHLVTLPVEWDASFGKALPILKTGYIHEEDHQAVESILKAAALTYVAASLTSLLNVWRWISLLRR
ncbi:MAG: probable metal-dependent peptidase [uncultured Thiotrichaceae bacterium]|uniref:Probable metal-dependent peptidase n=1 Tax=uncultured Thiotrichaceae bacterium TaxID=298394 RepID=A0A6S6UH45_9GAMM|nr:MAG: probable metal-dependent peptidase [uncultured Thiotrichaceae bacterium]